MNWTAQLVLRFAFMALCGAIVWYSFELKENGTDPNLTTFFRAWTWAIFGRFAICNQHPVWSSSRSPCIPLKAGTPCAFTIKAFALKPSEIVTKAASCGPSCGSSFRCSVASRSWCSCSRTNRPREAFTLAENQKQQQQEQHSKIRRSLRSSFQLGTCGEARRRRGLEDSSREMMMTRLLAKCMFERATVTTTDHDASMAEGWRGGVLRSKTVAATEREVAELHNDVERSTE